MRVLKSVARALDGLDFLVAQQKPVRLTDVAVQLQVDKSNASHILRTLVACGYAQQVDGRQYQASSKVHKSRSLGLEELIACRESMHPTLTQMGAVTGECVHMAVLVGKRVWYVDKIESTLPLKVDHPIGSLAPLHCTALGKAFIAFGEAQPTEELEGYTPKTIVTHAALDEEVKRTRARGYSVDDEEFTQGIRCVAVPIRDAFDKMIAAVGLSGPAARINDERLSELGQIVLQHIANHNIGEEHGIR